MDGVWCLEDEEGLLLHGCAVVGKVDHPPCQAVLKVLPAGCVLPIDTAAAAAAAAATRRHNMVSACEYVLASNTMHRVGVLAGEGSRIGTIAAVVAAMSSPLELANTYLLPVRLTPAIS
jgi:hypothetical protein